MTSTYFHHSFQDNVELKRLPLLRGLYLFLIVGLIVMPQYFGIHIGIDLTCSRVAVIFIMLYFVLNYRIFTHFFATIIRCEVLYPLLVYLGVAFYTMVLRVDINAFFMVFLEVLTFLLLIYGIRYVIGYKKACNIIVGCAYFLGVYGLIEFVYGKSIFHQFLSTVPNNVGEFYRSGQYRIMGPCGHALGYALLLLLFIAIICYDVEKDEIYLFRRPLLFVLLAINVFLTGSRSALIFFAIEIGVLIMLSNNLKRKNSVFILFFLFVLACIGVLVLYKTSLGQYVVGQVVSVFDEIVGTSYASYFGIDTQRLEDSTKYREVLPYIFTLDWLNPLVGRGNKFYGAEYDGVFIQSIDNYYVAQYIKFAYPGLISYVLYMMVAFVVMIKKIIVGSNITKMIFAGWIIYFSSLWFVDALQTLKFPYLFLAVFYAYYLQDKDLAHRK